MSADSLRRLVPVGSYVRLVCIADAYPHPRITWMRPNGEHLKHERGSTKDFVAEKSNAGNYTCTATNTIGSSYVTVELIVYGEL